MVLLFVVGRLILSLFFLLMASNHFRSTEDMATMAEANGVPRPRLAVWLSGLLLLVAGFSFLTGWIPVVGVVATTLFFVPVTFVMHAFWRVKDPQGQVMQMTNFLKNLAILGATWMSLLIETPWPLSLA